MARQCIIMVYMAESCNPYHRVTVKPWGLNWSQQQCRRYTTYGGWSLSSVWMCAFIWMHFSVRSGPTSSQAPSLPHWWYSRSGSSVRPAMVGWLLLSNGRKGWNIIQSFLFSLSPPLSQDNYHQIGLSQVETLRVDQLGMLAQVCDLCSFGFSTNDWNQIRWNLETTTVQFLQTKKCHPARLQYTVL